MVDIFLKTQIIVYMLIKTFVRHDKKSVELNILYFYCTYDNLFFCRFIQMH